MDKYQSILKFLQEKDLANGGFFAEPVNPVALSVPNYHVIITNPMNFSNIQLKLNLNKIPNYEEFGRLVRLVLENAICFNSDPHNAVHSAARNLSGFFYMKFKDVKKKRGKVEAKRGQKQE